MVEPKPAPTFVLVHGAWADGSSWQTRPLRRLQEQCRALPLVPALPDARASGGGRRSKQRHLTPLVGREEEIAMLMRRWERARRGENAPAAPAKATAAPPETVVRLAREHGMPLYSAYGEFLQPWARWHLGDREGGLDAMRRGIAACHDMGNLLFTTLLETALAEAEAEAGEIEAALARIDHAVALTERTDQRWNEADTHRVHGEILLKRDLANTGPAEDAFLTAIAIAQQQKAKSFELRAALSLAKLYQSTGRLADARAVLAPALEGFSPTPEFPDIAEAQALLTTLPS